MPEPLDPAARPSRLPLLAQIGLSVLLGISFLSGLLVWYGQILQAEELRSPVWLRWAVVAHGALNPLVCLLFGYLLCQHIRLGWQLKANRLSGSVLEGLLGGLILSGVGLYYAGSETVRAVCQWAHQVLGLALPLGVWGHWLAARRWVKKISK